MATTAVELKVPEVGESITEVQIGRWLKAEGEHAEKDEPVVVLETDKATVEVPAPVAGTIARIQKNPGQSAKVGEVIGYIEEGTAPVQAPAPAVGAAVPHVSPAVRRALAEHGLRAEEVAPSGPEGRLRKEDVVSHLQRATPAAAPSLASPASAGRQEEVVPMTPLRKRIAERLVAAQNTAALLTTFNEIDMSVVVALRQEHRERFLARYGVKLGFMSFFVKATIDALKQTPQLNAEIRGDDIVYRNYHDVGIAVGGGKGLVVPVLKDADRMSFADLEIAIADFAARAQEGRLKLDEIRGGTFTISNGGVYGSLLSTPIVNPPQSGVLGLHAIQDRPVARGGQVVVRPMMYVALTYDHRIVDGREAVTFLKRVKEAVEEPQRMLLEV